ncbi:MAG: DUF1127 domain-containing protein [Proteobacteria bacterium]|nr:DUF1127 domain-containing protein [Pseudomonadota bacterium]
MTTTTLKYQHIEQTATLQETASMIWTLFNLMLERAHQRRQLAELSTAQLLDMGITCEDALEESSKPFWLS